MPITPKLATAAYKTPINSVGPIAGRSFAQRFGDILNVKDFGALGNGVADDALAIQKTFDTAFGGPLDVGGASSPHGSANAKLNRRVTFPPGDYHIGVPLTLTQVLGGNITGCGPNTILRYTGAATNVSLLQIDGMVRGHIERLSFAMSGTNNRAIDLDRTVGTGVQLNNNVLNALRISGGGTGSAGIRVAQSGNDGADNKFMDCVIDGFADGFKIVGASALGQTFWFGGAKNCGVGVHIVNGSLLNILGMEFTSNSIFDVKVDTASISSPFLQACHSTSPNFASIVGNGMCSGVVHDGGGTFLAMVSPGRCVVQQCKSGGNITGTGVLYKRAAAGVGTVGYSGGFGQNI